MQPMPATTIDADLLLATAQRLGVALDRLQVAALVRFSALLLKWNRTHNLTAIERADEVLTHHLLDSLAIVPAILKAAERLGLAPPVRLLDVGSGGGLPAIPLAIACPWLAVTAVDKVQKKTAFLTQVRVELGLTNLAAVAARVETWQPPLPYPLIVSRAFSSLPDFVLHTRHLLAAQGRWLAMKGHRPDSELKGLPSDVAVVEVQPLLVPGLGEARHLIELEQQTA